MAKPGPILLLGTGAFAGRIAFDLAATARAPVQLVIAGRNQPRLDWLRTAARARAAMFGRPARIDTHQVDLTRAGAAEDLLGQTRPAVVVQAASVQPAAVIAQTGNAWTRLVAEAGLSATATFQALLTARIATAIRETHPRAHLINCCFPDVVNGIIAAMGLPITCGVGNVAILANAIAGALPPGARVQLLAHYQQLAPWRLPPAQRSGPTPRLWIDGAETPDLYARFPQLQLTTEPAIDISGAAGVPLILAIATGTTWSGHTPGPHGLPGGYPVRWEAGALTLDLPPGLRREEAIGWNTRFEAANGLTLDGTKATYTGRLVERLQALDPTLAAGFDVHDLVQTHAAWHALRTHLTAIPA